MKVPDYDLLLLLVSECARRQTYLLTITQRELRDLYFLTYLKPISPHALNTHLRDLEKRNLITCSSPQRSLGNGKLYFHPTTYTLTKKAIDYFSYLVTNVYQILNQKGGY